MKSLRFFLLDLGEETTSQGSEIWLWGIDDDGKNVLLVDRQFRPYLYAIAKEGFAPETILDALRLSGNRYASVLESSVEEKKLFGQIVKAVKVTCTSTETLEAIAKHLSKCGQVQQIIGRDIRYSSLYLYDRGLIPCRWHETEAQELSISPSFTGNAYLSHGSAHPIALRGSPELRILAFSIVAFAEKGSPHASQDPVSVISVATSDGEVRSFSRSNESDRDIITDFSNYLMGFDPDIVAGFESNRIGWPYLIERARRSGATLGVSRLGLQPHTSLYGHVSIAGRASLDMLDYANELPEVKAKSLENIAGVLGIKLDVIRPDQLDLAKIWNSLRDRPLLLRGADAYARVTLEITQRFLEFGMALSSLTCMPLD